MEQSGAGTNPERILPHDCGQEVAQAERVLRVANRGNESVVGACHSPQPVADGYSPAWIKISAKGRPGWLQLERRMATSGIFHLGALSQGSMEKGRPSWPCSLPQSSGPFR